MAFGNFYAEHLHGLNAPSSVGPPWGKGVTPLKTLPVTIVYQQDFWSGASADQRTFAQLDLSAAGVVGQLGSDAQSAGNFTSLDIEKWGSGDPVEPTDEATQVAHYRDIATVFAENYTGTLGLYGFPLFLDTSTFEAGKGTSSFTTWQQSNDLWFASLGGLIDVFQPIFYVRESTPIWKTGRWEAMMTAYIEECQRLDSARDIIPYVGIEYSSFASSTGPIPGDVAQEMWRFVVANCTGGLSWGGYQTDWDDSYPADGSMDWWFDGLQPFLFNKRTLI